MLSKFTPEEIARLESRLQNKKSNAKKRGIECKLTMEDIAMLGPKLLGHGICDYTGLPFSTKLVNSPDGCDNPKYPTIERIDDQVGYVRGNVCVVMQRANKLKDNLVDKKTPTSITDPVDREIVQGLILNMSKEHMEKLKTKYIPQKENEMNTDEIMQNTANNISVSYEKAPAQDVTTAEKSAQVELPDDVAVALAYANYCNTFAKVGMSVSVTYAQFKAKYSRKVCALTGEKLSEEPKSVLILDLDIGFAKDNFIIVSKTMEKALTQLMISTKMSLPKVAAMLSKVV